MTKKKTVLTVCYGNIQRSVIVQLCLSRELVKIGKEAEFEVLSRGIQGTMHTEAPKHLNLRYYAMEYGHTEPYLKEIGIEIPLEQKAILIDEEIVKLACLILAMDEEVLRTKRTKEGVPMSLMAQFPDHVSKMRLFMELVGKKENVPDCGDKDSAKLHRKMVMSINEVAKAGIHTMIRWACENY